MAIHQQEHNSSVLLDALYCEEERWEEQEQWESTEAAAGEVLDAEAFSAFSLPLLQQELFWEDDELTSLFSKEAEQHTLQIQGTHVEVHDDLTSARRDALAWMSKVVSHFGFTTLTALLAVNYLDRFLCSFHFQRDKPWMIQLVAVTCLSLAAKVEEIQVPLLLDLQLQVGETKYVFEAKTIQRMELLVLSALQWRMHPVTPLSFVDHITRRLGLKTHLHWEFQRRCERLLLSVVSDVRTVGCLPSVLATATMMHAIDQVEPFNSIHFKNQLLDVLKITQERVSDCYKLIVGLSAGSEGKDLKRRYYDGPSSPSGVIDDLWSSESSNDSWGVGPSPGPVFKRSRTQETEMRALLDIVASPS